jgi:6-phosphogluconolactonase
MTLSALLAAERIFLHITGEEKMNVLHKALDGGSVKKMPIRSILLQKRTPVEIFWAP